MASNVPSDSKPADTNRAHTNRTLRAKATTAYSRHTVCNRRLPVPGPSGHPTGTSQQMLRVVVEQRGLKRLRKCCQGLRSPKTDHTRLGMMSLKAVELASGEGSPYNLAVAGRISPGIRKRGEARNTSWSVHLTTEFYVTPPVRNPRSFLFSHRDLSE
jgi:hypothetical protein